MQKGIIKMELTVGSKGYGFVVKEIREIKEAGGTLILMEHEKTGAKLIWMKSPEKNKLFSVAFKTVPENSTGVFHILEHSVLGGSKKYPVREPFLELLKSSMQTFLNAITFPDKTLYPISSRNEQDFLNLTEVYLDAVFAPAILENPNIFYQEGWHIELDEEDQLSYKGVVLNEMKGATSSVDEQIQQYTQNMLYGDTCYGFNSGGDPKVIPSLTYEKFCSEYHRYYSATNAYFYLDGDIPFDRTMTLIEEYIGKQERVLNLPEIPEVSFAQENAVMTASYAIGPEESLEDQAHLNLARLVCGYQDKTKMLAIQVLQDVLTGSNEAPLTKAVLDKGLAKDVMLYLSNGILQPFLSLTLRNTNENQMDELKALVKATLEEIGRKGLDKDAMTAAVNQFEFQMKQPHEPQGLIRNIRVLESWLYGGDPALWLSLTDSFDAIRGMIADGGMDRLFAEIFLAEEGIKELRMLPSNTLTEELQKEENERLNQIRASWTEEDLAECRKLNQDLKAWQEKPDTPEQLATLPALSLSEVSDDVDWVETEELEEAGVKVLYHPVATNGVDHIMLYFSLGDFSLEELTKVSLLPSVLTNLATENYPEPLKLQEAIKTHLGVLDFSLMGVPVKNRRDLCKVFLTVKVSVLNEKLDKAFELVPEIALRTSMADHEAIRNIILQANESAKQYLIARGNSYAMTLVNAGYSAKGAAQEAAAGYTRDLFVRSLAQDKEGKVEEEIVFLEKAAKKIFTRARLTASLTAAEKVSLAPLFEALPEGEKVPEAASYQTSVPDHVGIVIPAQIGYAAAAYNMSEDGAVYHGSLMVLSNIMTYDYLWNMVRVRGGAYGTGFSVGRDGLMTAYSYRDPSPAGSLGIYGKMAEAVDDFIARGETLDRYIISTISELDPLMMPGQRGQSADNKYFIELSHEEFRALLREILSTTPEMLLSWREELRKIGTSGRTAVVAHEQALKEIEGLTILN